MTQSSFLRLAVLCVLAVGLETVRGQCENDAVPCLDEINTLKDKLVAARASVTASETKLLQKITECSFPCPDGFIRIPDVKKCIKFVREAVTWDGGQAKCVSYHAKSHLAFIESAAEHDFVVKTINSWPAADRAANIGIFIGGQREDKTCYTKLVWKSASGVQTPITYSRFQPGEPNCPPGGVEGCLHLYTPFGYNWNDIPCNHGSMWALCQYA